MSFTNVLTKPKSLISRGFAESVKDPAPEWMWMFSVIGVKNLAFVNPIYVLDIDLGFPSLTKETILWGGKYIHVPQGPQSYPTMQLELYEDHRYYATSIIVQWMKQAMNNRNHAGLPRDYCGTGYLLAFDSMGYPVLEITIDGMWPLWHNNLRMTQRSGPVRKTVVFSYNAIHMMSEQTVASGLLNSIGLGSGFVGDLVQGAVGGGLTLIPGL